MTNQGGWGPPDQPAWPPQPPPAQPPPSYPPPGGAWQPQPAYNYGTPPGGQKADGLAIWSLVLGILSFIPFFFIGPFFAIPAIITGVLGKKKVDQSGGVKTGRGMAQAGFILGIVNVILVGTVATIIIVVAIGASKHTQYTDLQTGDCYNRLSSNSIFKGEVDKVPCSQAHDTEVTGKFEATGSTFPGTDGFKAQAMVKCGELETQYLGTNLSSVVRITWLAPVQNTWDSGIHTVVCGVQNADGSKHTGSVNS